MAESSLEIKIKALVEGLDGLNNLRDSLQDVVDFVDDVADKSKNASTGLGSLDTQAGEAASSIKDVRKGVDGLGETLTEVGQASERAGKGLEEIGNVSGEVANGLQEVSVQVGQVTDSIGQIDAGTREATTALGNLTTVAEDSSANLGEVSEAAQSAGIGVGDLGDATGEATDGLGELSGTSEDITGNLDEIASSAQVAKSGFEDIAGATGDVVDTLGELSGVAEEAGGGVEDTGASAEESSGKFVQLIAKLKELVEGLLGVGDATDDFEQESEQAEKASGGLVSKITSLGDSLTDLGGTLEDSAKKIDGVTEASDKSVGAAQDLVQGLKPLVGALVAIAGISISFDYLKEAASYAASIETLGITMGVVGKNTGYTTEELNTFEKDLKKAGISTEAARGAMTEMMNAGLALGTQTGQTRAQVLLLADASKDLAVVTGENTSETMARLTQNIQQLDTEGLRFMGLIVDSTAAQDKFAASLGTSAGALTESQKRQAVLNEVLVQASKMTGAYDAAMESVGKKLSSMTRLQEELSLSIGNKLLPAYGAIVDAATLLLKSLGKQADEFDKNGESAKSYGKGLEAALTPIVPIINELFSWLLKAFEIIAPVFEQVGVAIGSLMGLLGDMVSAAGTTAGSLSGLQTAAMLLSGAFAAMADGIDFIRIGFNGLVALVATALGAIMSKVAAIAEWLPLPQRIKDGVSEAATAIDKLATDSGNKAQELAGKFERGETHIAKWTETLNKGLEEAKKFDSGPAQKFSDTITNLIKQQNEQTLSSIQVAAETDKIKAALDAAVASNQISQKEYAMLSMSLASVARTIQEELDKAFKLLGTSSNQLASGISDDASVIIGALTQVAENGRTTSDQFAALFGDNIGVAKTVQELVKFSNILDEAKGRWPEAPKLFSEAQGQISKNFEEIYQKQLKALKTSDDWGQLKESIVKLGNEGALSVGQVKIAIEEGEKAVNRLSPAFIAAADASTKIGASIEQVEIKITQLRTAIDITADKAITAYEGMAEGYSTLADNVAGATERQVEVLESRYAKEASLAQSTITDVEELEQTKFDLLVGFEESKTALIEKGAEKQLAFIRKEESATQDALAVKLLALDTEVAKVEEALGKQGADRDEHTRKLKELEKEREVLVAESENTIRQKKIDVMQTILDRYKAHIDSLNAEEDRHLEKVKAIEEQKAQAKMSLEEKLRALDKQGMSEYEAYQQTMSDVAELQSKAREAAANGEAEAAKEYLSQAKSAAMELNTVVKDGEKVYIDKQTALENTKEALISLGQTEQEILENSKNGEQQLADAAGRAKDKVVETAAKAKESLDQMRADGDKGVEILIDAKDDQARARLRELKDLVTKEEMLTTLSIDLKEALEQYENIKEAIEKGGEMPVGVEAEKAYAALGKLKEYAQETNNTQLEMDVSAAMAAIDQTKAKVNEVDGMKPSPQVNITINGEEKLESAAAKMKAIDTGEPVRGIVEFQTENEDKLDQVVYKITKLKDNSVIYTKGTFDVTEAINNGDKLEALYTKIGAKETLKTNHTLETDAEEKGKKIDEAMRARDPLTTTATIETNADEQKAKIEEAMRQRDTTNTATIETNADEAKSKIEGATESVKAQSENTIETNADEQKGKIDAALEEKQTTSKHTVESNAEELMSQIKATLEVPTQGEHKVNSDHDTVAAALKAAMETPTQSEHKVNSDHETIVSDMKAAMEVPTQSEHKVNSDHEDIASQIKSSLESPTQSEHSIDTAGVEQAKSEIEALNSEETKSTHTVDTSGIDQAKSDIQTLSSEETESTHTIDTSGIDQAKSDIQALSSEETESTHTIDTSGIDQAKGDIDALNSEQTESKHTIEVDSSQAKSDIQALESEETTSKHTIEVDRSQFDADMAAIKEEETESKHTVKPDLESAKAEIQSLNDMETKSTHTVETSQVEQARSEIMNLNSAMTQSQHTITTNVEEAMSQIHSLSGKNTSSVHTIYVVKEYLFGLGGFFGYADGGEVGPNVPGKKTRLYPLQTSGMVPGAANYDSVPRTLPVGSYIINKKAVAAHGAANLLEFFDQAKQLPKKISSAMGKTKAWLMPGEIVVDPDVSSRLGTRVLDQINYHYDRKNRPLIPHFEQGGLVGGVDGLLRDQMSVGYIGQFYEKGGGVKPTPSDVVQVDLRANLTAATVTVQRDQTKNLLDVLTELKNRAA